MSSFSCFITCDPADNREPGRQWATWLKETIESFEVPADLIGQRNSRGEIIPARLSVFVSDPKLDPAAPVSSELEESACLLVICSPRAAASFRVSSDIRFFRQHGRDERVFAVIIEGEPNISWHEHLAYLGYRPEDECFPATLRYRIDAQGKLLDERVDQSYNDLRLEDSRQGWAGGDAYCDALIEAGKTNQAAVLDAYERKCEQVMLRLIAGILGIATDELTKREALRPRGGQTNTVSRMAERSAVVSRAALSKPEGPKPIYDEDVQFSVYRPKTIAPGKWATMLAFAHLSKKAADAPDDEADPVQEVARQARQVLGNLEAYQNLTQDSSQAIPRQGDLTMVPEVTGLRFNPPRRTFTWEESVHREEFRLITSEREMVTPATLRGRMTIFLGSLIIAEIPLAFRVDEREEVASPSMETAHARPYRKIFASYSHHDATVVEHLEHYARGIGDSYLRDIMTLKPGQKWNPQLLKMIEEADVFQLFWSSNSMVSKYCRQEWEYALDLNRPDFIRPTFWEEPMPKMQGLPPPALREIHFQKIEAGRLPTVERPSRVESCAAPAPCPPPPEVGRRHYDMPPHASSPSPERSGRSSGPSSMIVIGIVIAVLVLLAAIAYFLHR